MNSPKKKRLSLKRPKAAKDGNGENKTSTILSMFKRQKKQDAEPGEAATGSNRDTTVHEEQSVAENISDTDRDVVITKVEKSFSFLPTTSAYFPSPSERGDKTGKQKKRSRLSLRKCKSETASAAPDSESSPGRYNFRKRSTVPLIDAGSDSEDNATEQDTSPVPGSVVQQGPTASSEEDLDDVVFQKIEYRGARGRKSDSSKLSLGKRKSKDADEAQCNQPKRLSLEVVRSSHDINKCEPVSVDKCTSDPASKEVCSKTAGSSGKVGDDKTTSNEKTSRRTLLESQKIAKKNLKGGTPKIVTSNDNNDDIISNSNSKDDSSRTADKNTRNTVTASGQSTESRKVYSLFMTKDVPKKFAHDEKEVLPSVSGKDVEEASKLSDPQEVTVVGSAGDAVDDVDETENDGPVYRVPYYLENFRTILKTVLDDSENARLFNTSDMDFVTSFNSLEENTQKLYVRLFSRKLAWLPVSKLSYPDISSTLEDLVEQLVAVNLLVSGDHLEDLETALNVMAAPDLKLLAKSFRLNVSGSSKPAIIEQLMKKSQENSISSMFTGGGSGNTAKTMMTRARSYLGRLCHLAAEPRAVFIRVLMLFSLYNTNIDEDSGAGGQNQLFQMLMVNIGRVVYPKYTVNRQQAVFKDREALIRFEKALQLELELLALIEKHNWAGAHTRYLSIKAASKDIISQNKLLEWDANLPLFLRPYTAGSVYTRIDNQGVEILQRLKKYKEAVQLLQDLIHQELYCTEYRGHWYDRLALNLDAHLKSPAKSLDAIRDGLNDDRVKTGRRLSLFQRAEKICGAPKSKFAERMTSFVHDKVIPAPEYYVDGMVMPDATSMGMKYQFIMAGDTESVTLCAVEELALEHYSQNGFPEGLHAEGSIISNLFCLLFWDILFMDVPDVFQSPFQTHPLDMHTPDFYTSRRQAIDDRLAWLQTASEQVILEEVSRIWEEHCGTMCAGINWEKFDGPQTLQGLMGCMGGKIIAAILERYVKNPRHTRSGFPDLTLWNTDDKTFKISEVKGPGDRLSHKQILWLDFLLKLGVDAEVCYVKAVGSKKLKPTVK